MSVSRPRYFGALSKPDNRRAPHDEGACRGLGCRSDRLAALAAVAAVSFSRAVRTVTSQPRGSTHIRERACVARTGLQPNMVPDRAARGRGERTAWGRIIASGFAPPLRRGFWRDPPRHTANHPREGHTVTARTMPGHTARERRAKPCLSFSKTPREAFCRSLAVASHQTMAAKRTRTQTAIYNPETDGANDSTRLGKVKKTIKKKSAPKKAAKKPAKK